VVLGAIMCVCVWRDRGLPTCVCVCWWWGDVFLGRGVLVVLGGIMCVCVWRDRSLSTCARVGGIGDSAHGIMCVR